MVAMIARNFASYCELYTKLNFQLYINTLQHAKYDIRLGASFCRARKTHLYQPYDSTLAATRKIVVFTKIALHR